MRCGTKPLRFYRRGTPLQQPGAADVPVSQSAGKYRREMQWSIITPSASALDE